MITSPSTATSSSTSLLNGPASHVTVAALLHGLRQRARQGHNSMTINDSFATNVQHSHFKFLGTLRIIIWRLTELIAMEVSPSQYQAATRRAILSKRLAEYLDMIIGTVAKDRAEVRARLINVSDFDDNNDQRGGKGKEKLVPPKTVSYDTAFKQPASTALIEASEGLLTKAITLHKSESEDDEHKDGSDKGGKDDYDHPEDDEDDEYNDIYGDNPEQFVDIHEFAELF